MKKKKKKTYFISASYQGKISHFHLVYLGLLKKK